MRAKAEQLVKNGIVVEVEVSKPRSFDVGPVMNNKTNVSMSACPRTRAPTDFQAIKEDSFSKSRRNWMVISHQGVSRMLDNRVHPELTQRKVLRDGCSSPAAEFDAAIR